MNWLLLVAAAAAHNLGAHDALRARQIKPRSQFRGAGAHGSALVLNKLLNQRYGTAAVPCEDWTLESLQTLQRDMWEQRAAGLNNMYANQTLADGVTQDRRTIGGDLSSLQARWAALDAATDSPGLRELRRDGHCYDDRYN